MQQEKHDNSSEPKLCVACNRFYGNPTKDGLCSLCYATQLKAQGIVEPKTSPKPTIAVIAPDPEPKEEEKQESLTTRCNKCNIRVGYLGYKCKCGSIFCAKHRHFDQHDCWYNFKTEGKAKILKANPVVEHPKLNKL